MALHDDAEKASPRSSGETANEAGWDETAQLFHPDRNPEPKYFVFHAAPQSQRLLLLCRHTVARVRARVADKRRPLTLAAALVGLVLLIVTLAHVGLFRVRGHRGGPGGGSSSSVAELLKTISHDTFGGSTEYCTTWPVAEDGAYNATRSAPRPNDLDTLAPSGGWAKPDGFKVVGLIFYGRRRNVDTLDCYLMQNLAVNGGYLDEVHFIVHTDEDHDIAFLNQLVAARDHYQIEEVGPCEGHDFSCMWDTSTKTDTLYIKIDDDIAFIHPDAIPQLVHTRIAEPHPFAISANLVNSPLTAAQHWHYGAIHPVVPDPKKKPSFKAAETWRQSDKKINPHAADKEKSSKDAIQPSPPYKGHTWYLLSRSRSWDLLKTPMGRNYDLPKGKEDYAANDWSSWAIAAQQHYSLLINLELNAVAQYFFGSPVRFPNGKNERKHRHKNGAATALDMEARGPDTTTNATTTSPSTMNTTATMRFSHNYTGPGGEQLFDTQYIRYNLNFIAIWGQDVKRSLPLGSDDEYDLSVTMPRKFKRPFIIDTRSVVSHFSFYPQYDGMKTTDLLDRYRAYANEQVCAADNQKKPFDRRCEGF